MQSSVEAACCRVRIAEFCKLDELHDNSSVSSPHTPHTQLTAALSRRSECCECCLPLRRVRVSEERVFDFGLVLSIEHRSTNEPQQRLDCVCHTACCTHRQRSQRTQSAVVRKAVKAVCCHQSDGGVLNFWTRSITTAAAVCHRRTHAHTPLSSTTIRKHLGEL